MVVAGFLVLSGAGCTDGDAGGATATRSSTSTPVESGSVATSTTGPEADAHRVDVRLVTADEPKVLDFACDGEGRCLVPIIRPSSTFEGTMDGTTVSSGTGSPTADGGYDAVAIQVFSGTVDACGSGSFQWRETLRSSGAGGEISGTWEVIEGRGTGELTSLAGSGTFRSGPGDAVGTVEGSVTCP